MQLQKLPSIWTDSSISINFVNSNTVMDKSKRFQYNSIYYKDDPTKPKKKVDQFMFPHDLLNNFRKCIKQASKSKSRQKKKVHIKSAFDDDQQSKEGLPPRVHQITTKLYKKPQSIAGQRDFFGNRCSFQQKQLGEMYRLPHFNHPSPRASSHQKIYITAAQRLDLSRPINFNPGPGAYIKNIQGYKRTLNSSNNSQQGLLKRKARQRVLKSIQVDNKRYGNH